MRVSLYVSFFALPAIVHGQAKAVSFGQLAKAPETYQGELIQVTGFFVHDFENSGLYPSKAWKRNRGIWVNPNGEMLDQRANLKDHYLRLTGVFNGHNHGHMGQFLGTLTVREFAVAEEPKGQ